MRDAKICFPFLFCFSLSLKDEKWSKSFDPKLQGLLSDLESGLGSVVRQSNPESSGKQSVKEEDILGGCWKVLDSSSNFCGITDV